MGDPRNRRDDLTRWMASSRALQRRMRWVGLGGVVLAIALQVGGAGGRAVVGVIALAAIVVGTSLWITHGHIEDFRRQLRELERRRA